MKADVKKTKQKYYDDRQSILYKMHSQGESGIDNVDVLDKFDTEINKNLHHALLVITSWKMWRVHFKSLL